MTAAVGCGVDDLRFSAIRSGVMIPLSNLRSRVHGGIGDKPEPSCFDMRLPIYRHLYVYKTRVYTRTNTHMYRKRRFVIYSSEWKNKFSGGK